MGRALAVTSQLGQECNCIPWGVTGLRYTYESTVDRRERITVSAPIEISQVDHIGIRVADAPRSEAFYALLGFAVVWRSEAAPVVILRNASGVEINFIVNADPALDGTNALMDVPEKRAGYTHIALRVASAEQAVRALGAVGVVVTEGPVRLGDGLSLFVRDPDRNVIELREIVAP